MVEGIEEVDVDDVVDVVDGGRTAGGGAKSDAISNPSSPGTLVNDGN